MGTNLPDLTNYDRRPPLDKAIYHEVLSTLANWLPSDSGPQALAGWGIDHWLAAEWTTYWQNALPWFYLRLGEMGKSLAPPDIWQRLSAVNSDSRQRTRLMLDDSVEILKSLRSQKIEGLPLKGAVLAACYYTDPLLRPFGDLDILIHKRDIPKVDAIMTKLGYSFLKRTAKDHVYLRGKRQAHPYSPDNVRPVEVQHMSLNEYGGMVYDLAPLLWRHREEQHYWDGFQFALSNKVALFHHVCAHASEDFMMRRAKLSQFLDIGTLAAQLSPDEWQRFVEQLTNGAVRFVYPSLLFSVQVGAISLPAHIEEQLRSQTPPQLQEWVSKTNLAELLELRQANDNWQDLNIARLYSRSPMEYRRAQLRLTFPPRWHFRLNKYPRLIASPFWPLAYVLITLQRLGRLISKGLLHIIARLSPTPHPPKQ